MNNNTPATPLQPVSKALAVGDKVTARDRPDVLTVTRIHDGYASTQRDHGHCVTAGYYPLHQLVKVAEPVSREGAKDAKGKEENS